MAGIFTFAAVDCDDQTNRALCAEFAIQGFPTIKFMKPFRGTLDAQGTLVLGSGPDVETIMGRERRKD